MNTPKTLKEAKTQGYKVAERADQVCYICGNPYRGENVVPVNQGYGVYKSEPAHVRCEREWN